MEFNYLFLDKNNGHYNTFHPFRSPTLIDQNRVTAWLSMKPGAGRIGTNIHDLFVALEKNEILYSPFLCPCCKAQVYVFEDFDFLRCKSQGIEWNVLEGITGELLDDIQR